MDTRGCLRARARGVKEGPLLRAWCPFLGGQLQPSFTLALRSDNRPGSQRSNYVDVQLSSSRLFNSALGTLYECQGHYDSLGIAM